jgi:hypothetical protein
MLKVYVLLGVCLLACAVPGFAADCETPTGDYAIRLSGFGGGSPVFYPIALVGNITIEKNGDVTGNYKLLAPMTGGTKESRTFTGKLSVKACAGTLTFKDGTRTTHTFVVVQSKGTLTLALGDNGLIISGTAEQ